jgi:tRNA(fMet)-specific endonuclease VapC
MAWLLDTNAWIQILKQPAGRLEQEVLSRPPSEIVFCSIVKAELWHGANKYARRDRRLAALDALFAPFVSYPFDDQAARHYADIRHRLEQAGIVIGPNDLKIAAICRARGLILVSSNTGEFLRVPGLRVEDWSST